MTRTAAEEGFQPSGTADRRVDIAIVGAGISGAYTAWRLKQRYPNKTIELFEYSDRVGGRLYSRVLPGMPNIHAEVGGMRFIPKTQPLVTGLIAALELATRDFPMGYPDNDDSNNIVYLRRRLMRMRDLVDPAKVPYLMNPTEQGMGPDTLQKYVMLSLFPNAASFSQEDWYKATAFGGEPLYMLGFWNLLYRMLSSEAYQFMDDAGGYYTNVANTNAVSSLPVDDYSASVKYRTLVDGYQQLPITLVERFRDLGGIYSPNQRLMAFGRDEGQSYLMRFEQTRTDPDGKTHPHGPISHIHAEQIILAMPRRSLELVYWEGFQQPWLREHIPSVISQAAFKIFLAYPYPWWRQLGVRAGRSITDMPLRQTYYFQTECEMPGGDPSNQNSLMMVSYNDLGSVPFWKALEAGQPFPGRPNPFVEPGREILPHRFTITSQMVAAAQAQVREVHGLIYVPEPYSAVYQDWSEDPFGAGWHGWKAGVKFWEVIPRMCHPINEEQVYICGEAYSNNQGWVEGALETAETVLQEGFQLDPPDWQPEGRRLHQSTLHAVDTAAEAVERLLAGGRILR